MYHDLNSMLMFAADIFNGLAPVLGLVVVISLGIRFAQFTKRQADELSILQNGRLNPPEAPYNPDDPLNYFTELKRKNEEKRKNDDKPKNDQIVRLGDDGELIFEGEEEPDYMRRFQ